MARSVIAALAFMAALGLTGYRAAKDFAVPGLESENLSGMRDFRDAVYFPVACFLQGISPYHDEYREFHPEGADFPAFSPCSRS